MPSASPTAQVAVFLVELWGALVVLPKRSALGEGGLEKLSEANLAKLAASLVRSVLLGR